MGYTPQAYSELSSHSSSKSNSLLPHLQIHSVTVKIGGYVGNKEGEQTLTASGNHSLYSPGWEVGMQELLPKLYFLFEPSLDI